jgi:hypothetical protein
MTCSICRKGGHNKRTCVLKVRCLECGNKGHHIKHCSFWTIYHSIPCLPTEIVGLIQNIKSEMEITDNYKLFFQTSVLKDLIKIGGFQHKKRHNSYGLKKIMYPQLKHILYQFNHDTMNHERIRLTKIMYDLIYDFRWLYVTYEGFNDVRQFMDVVIQKIDYLFLNGFYNCWVYCNMFKTA